MSELSVHPVGRFFVKRDGALGPASWSGLALVVVLAFAIGFVLHGGPAPVRPAKVAPSGARGAVAAPGPPPALTGAAAVPALRVPVRRHRHHHHAAAPAPVTTAAPVATKTHKATATATPAPRAVAPTPVVAPRPVARPVPTRAPAVLVPVQTATPAPKGPSFDSSG